MKKQVLVILFLLACFSAISQEYRFSLNPVLGSSWYLVKSSEFEKVKQDGNYDAGVLFSYKVNKVLELKTGLVFYSKRFSEYFYPIPLPLNTWYPSENHFYLYYYRIPVLFGLNVMKRKKFNVYTNIGFSLGHLYFKNRSTTYYNGAISVGFDTLTYYYRDPLFFDIGAGVRYYLTKKMSLTIEPWYRYMYLEDFVKVKDTYWVTLSHSQLGGYIGLNYDFNVSKIFKKHNKKKNPDH